MNRGMTILWSSVTVLWVQWSKVKAVLYESMFYRQYQTLIAALKSDFLSCSIDKAEQHNTV